MNSMMNWFKEHIIGVVIIMIILSAINIIQWMIYKNDIEEYEAKLGFQVQTNERLTSDNVMLSAEKERLVDDVTSLIVDKKQETEQLTLEIESLNDKIESAIIPFDFVMLQLENKGFKTSEELLATLSEENDLIPFDGVLGGTMKWWPTESKIINNKWVLGYFEDGHILGHALLEYHIDDQKNVAWKLIEAILY